MTALEFILGWFGSSFITLLVVVYFAGLRTKEIPFNLAALFLGPVFTVISICWANESMEDRILIQPRSKRGKK